MEFSSSNFLLFLFFIFVIYWNISKKFQWIFLLLVSYFFYLSWKPVYGIVLLVTTLMSYYLAIGIEKYPKYKKILFVVSILINLFLLIIFKYLNFFQTSFVEILPVKILTPIGISFYSFQTISYLADVYSRKVKAERHLGVYALFILFFPKFISGPIEKGADLLPQLHITKNFQYKEIIDGLKLFIYGLFKKVVIADNLRLIVDQVFFSLTEYKGLSLVLTIVFFSFQIYADFSGYTDMARGIAKMFGIELTSNFNYPYLSGSISEFWKRWHISLSRWLREYIYIPLGGNRKGEFISAMNTLFVFLICGIWHGASWTFIIWGLFHAIVIICERLIHKLSRGSIVFPKIIRIVYTYTLVCISWVFFRASNIQDALYIFRYSLSGAKHFIDPNYVWASLDQLFKSNQVEMIIAFFCLFCGVILEIISKSKIDQSVKNQPFVLRFAFYTAIMITIVLLRNIGPTEFIYVQF